MSFIERIYAEAAANSEKKEQERMAWWEREFRYCHAKGWEHLAIAVKGCI